MLQCDPGACFTLQPVTKARGTVSDCRLHVAGQGVGLSPELKSAIDSFIADNKIVLFMKGNRMFPQCGFSNTCVQVRGLQS